VRLQRFCLGSLLAVVILMILAKIVGELTSGQEVLENSLALLAVLLLACFTVYLIYKVHEGRGLRLLVVCSACFLLTYQLMIALDDFGLVGSVPLMRLLGRFYQPIEDFLWLSALFLLLLAFYLSALETLAAKLRLAEEASHLSAQVDERRRAEEALKKSAQMYRGAIEVAGAVPYYQDYKSMTYEFMGSEIELLTGYRPEEFTYDTWEAMEQEIIRLGEIKGLSEEEAIAKARSSEGVSWRADYRIKTRSGEEKWVSNAAVQVRDEEGQVVGSLVILRDITERKRAEIALKESEERLRNLTENIPGVSIQGYRTDGAVFYWNKSSETVYGFSAEEAIGRNLGDLIVPPPLRQQFAECLEIGKQVERSGEFMPPGELMLLHKQGHLVPVYSMHTAVCVEGKDPLLFCIDIDLSEQKKSEKVLEEREALLNATLESTADGLLVVDEKGRVSHTNTRFARMWRIPPELVETRDDKQLQGFVLEQLEDPEGFLSKVRQLYTSSDEGFDTIRFKDGRVFERFSCPLMRDHEVAGRVWSFRDVTERRRAEKERLDLQVQLQEAQKLESLGVLAGGIAHDFNNLLMAILGNADLALQDLPELSPARPLVEEIDKASRRAADLTRQMLAYSGKGHFVIRSTDLSVLAREMAHLLRTSISKKVTLRTNLGRGLPLVKADVAQMQQVVMNLITNASEACEAEGGTIVLSTGVKDCDRRYLSGGFLRERRPEGTYVYVEVADTGCGMDAETRRKIFDPFFTTKFAGRGLGLAAVLGIVRGHDGAIVVDSQEGKGTTIRVLFPALDQEMDQPEEREVSQSEEWRGRGTVLLVDDEASVLAVGKRMLGRLGFGVLTARDGKESVEVFQEFCNQIDCVLLDLTMPQMDGEESLAALREIREDIPVILSSGYTEQEFETRFAGKNVAGFIQKPYRTEDLRAKLREALSQ